MGIVPVSYTHLSAIGAYTQMSPKWKFLGILTFLVPVLIMTYYAVIGGWVTKYAVVYLTGQTAAAAQDNYFTSFITSPVSVSYTHLDVYKRQFFYLHTSFHLLHGTFYHNLLRRKPCCFP